MKPIKNSLKGMSILTTYGRKVLVSRVSHVDLLQQMPVAGVPAVHLVPRWRQYTARKKGANLAPFIDKEVLIRTSTI